MALNQELVLLQALTASKEEKTDLPAALHYLDRSRLTFPRPPLIPFLRAVERRMLEILNESNYQRYGSYRCSLIKVIISYSQSYSHFIMQITKTTVLEDQTLRQTFQRCVDEVVSPVDQDTVSRVYSAKMFNEYLRGVSTEATQRTIKQ